MSDKADKYRELVVLSIVPGAVGILTLASWVLAHWQVGPYFVNAGLAIFATLFGGWLRLLAGFKDIFRRKITVNVFVAVALIATLAIGEFRAAAVIVFIMAAAGALESYTLDKTRRSIRKLLDLAPKTATVRRNGEEVVVSVNEIAVGDIAVVRPGGRIPVDGVVAAGHSSVNQAPITGESIPVEKFTGSEVFGGTLNETGRLEVRAVKVGKDTTLARIVHLVEQAQGTKAPIQTLADRFTAWFLPMVLVLAAIAYLGSGDIKVAVSVLLVACPCAFAIATPTAVTAGISNMARRSVLIKGGIFLELARKLDVLLVDKTGTFTFGRPRVAGVVAFDGLLEQDVLRLAAVAEKYSEHPLARSIMARATEWGLRVADPDHFVVEVGMGVTAQLDGQQILVGKDKFLRDKGVSITAAIYSEISAQSERGRTPVLVAADAKPVGLIAIADEIRAETPHAIAALKGMGIKNITMLTGDNYTVAQAVAAEIGVDDFRAELLPEQKLQFVEKLQAEGKVVGMIGDGINDAPALALADVGIAMGAAGTDVAVETADVTLMNDDLSRVVNFMEMSRKVLFRIKLNIFFSMFYNVIGFILAGFGLLTPVLAVVFQEIGCLTVVLSSTLLLWAKTGASLQGSGRDSLGVVLLPVEKNAADRVSQCA
ncbi:MAG: cation-translocating P-type ATPase [Phycisphaerae bacterium]|nr:cation-translocating P-type ATPase [Phycisphaerae bacterium]